MRRLMNFLFALGVLFCLTSFMHFKPVDGPNSFVEQLKGEWILDSVQVKEIMSGEVNCLTVLPGSRAKFDHAWMLRFKLDGEGKASYIENSHVNVLDRLFSISDVPYEVKNIEGNTATLIINGVPEYKILNIQLPSDSTMLIRQSFTTAYKIQEIEVFWTFFYHKSKQSNSN